jgi:hypothetical protein
MLCARSTSAHYSTTKPQKYQIVHLCYGAWCATLLRRIDLWKKSMNITLLEIHASKHPSIAPPIRDGVFCPHPPAILNMHFVLICNGEPVNTPAPETGNRLRTLVHQGPTEIAQRLAWASAKSRKILEHLLKEAPIDARVALEIAYCNITTLPKVKNERCA